MADKVFTVEDLLPLGVSLNIPPFWEGKKSSQEVVETQSIAFLRIHVESMGQYSVFTMFGVVNQMWSVYAMLCNFQNSIISA